MNNNTQHRYITDQADYRHLKDRNRYKALYEEVGAVEANKTVRWREEWMKHFRPREGAKILELGAHNGPNLIHYARTGRTVHGVELSDTLCDTFESHLAGEPANVRDRVRMYRGWIEEFRPEIRYDHVVCAEILEHVKDPVEILKVARKALEPNGTIYISSPFRHWGNNTHVRGAPVDDLKQWLSAASLTYSEIWSEEDRTFCIAHGRDIRVIGLIRARNEAAIIQDTLDHAARFCNGGIYIYDDVSTDATAEICRAHPAVREVIIGEFWDGNRGRANCANRAAVLTRAKLQARSQDWFVYLDADERIEFDWSSLISCPADVIGVRMELFDYYITPEDVEKNYKERKWLGPEYRPILMVFRNLPSLSYWAPGCREVDLGVEGRILDAGFVKHYGKAVSIQQWEENCRYYSTYFAGYAAKWNARKGKTVHTQSDFGNELITWEEKESKGIPLTPQIELAAQQKLVARPQGALRILLTNHHLLDYTGSELFIYTVADFLKRKGHEVTAYSRYVDKIARRLQSIGVRVVQNLDDISGEHFDVAHVHHNINAMEVRHRFPNLPIVFVSHGVLPFLEQPPAVDLRISRYLAVSEEVKENLMARGVNEKSIVVFRNLVDSQRFTPSSRVRAHLQRGLVISSRIDEARENVIKTALSRLDIEAKFVGGRFGEIDPFLLPLYINNADIVFSLGRGVIETMLCGRIPIIYDYHGGDGMVTPDNVGQLMKCNFSGRTHRKEYTAEDLAGEILKYRPEYGEQLRAIALERFDAHARVPDLVQIYRDAMSCDVLTMDSGEMEKLSAFINVIRETRDYSYNQLVRRYDRMRRELSLGIIPQPALLGAGAETSKSISELRDLLWLDVEDSGAHNELGLHYYHQGDRERALEHFRRAVEIDRENAKASKNLALLYVERWPEFVRERDERNARNKELESQVKSHQDSLMHAEEQRHSLECNLTQAEEQRRTLERQMARVRGELYLVRMKGLASRIRRCGIREVIAYGAGEAGRALVMACRMTGVRICCVVDKKESLWGSRVENVEVLPLVGAMAKGVHAYAVGSFAFASEIKSEIRHAYAGAAAKPRIFAWNGGS